jgi:hypothetical protein
MVAEKKYVAAGREFLHTVDGMDQRKVVDAIVHRTCAIFPNTDPEELRPRVWRDLGFHFGWRDVADLEPAGAA